MNYYTKDWYKNGCKKIDLTEYNKFIESNYKYYPNWFKKHYGINKEEPFFHDYLIDSINSKNGDIIINFGGIYSKCDKDLILIFKNAEFVNRAENELFYIEAEELYCDENGMKLCLLAADIDEEYVEEILIKSEDIKATHNISQIVHKPIVYKIIKAFGYSLMYGLFTLFGFVLGKLV